MKCTQCGKDFPSYTNSGMCWDCMNKLFKNQPQTDNISNCDIPIPQGFGKQGWICPVCGRGLSPWTDFCPCQSDMKITYGTKTDGTYDIQDYIKYMETYNKKSDRD